MFKTYFHKTPYKAIQYTEETKSKIENYLTDNLIFWENKSENNNNFLSIFRGDDDFLDLNIGDYLLLINGRVNSLSKVAPEKFQDFLISIDEIKKIEV